MNTEKLYGLAQELIETVTEEEAVAWKSHPLTKALSYVLAGDRQGIHEQWEQGTFTSETADGTAQDNARALGQVQAINDVQEWLAEVVDKTRQEEE